MAHSRETKAIYIDHFPAWGLSYRHGCAHDPTAIDWTDCSLVESVPGKVSGVSILKGTRVQADSIVENYEGGSPIDEVSENFAIPEAVIQQVLSYALRSKQAQQ